MSGSVGMCVAEETLHERMLEKGLVLMNKLLCVTSALLVALSYGCAKDDDDDDDVPQPQPTQTTNPSTAGGSIAECVDACIKDAADCAAACTGGGNCSATCDTTFASCERECEQIGK